MKIFVPTVAECKLVTLYDSCIVAFRKHNEPDTSVSWVSDPRAADIIVLFEEWGSRFWQYSDILSGDPFFKSHWRRIFTINCDDLGRGFLPGCYTSLTKTNFERDLHRACPYPYEYNEYVAMPPPYERRNAKWLFSFRGTDVSHSIRRKIFRYFSGHPRARIVRTGTRFHSHSATEKQDYVDDILASKFALCPRGWSPATYRLFEVMELGRCPVIISDDWIPIDGVPWQECSITVNEVDIAHLPDILSEKELCADELGAMARQVWESNFSEPNKFRAMLRSILELADKVGANQFDYRRRWSSWRFHYANEWLPHQRLIRKAQQKLELVERAVNGSRTKRW